MFLLVILLVLVIACLFCIIYSSQDDIEEENEKIGRRVRKLDDVLFGCFTGEFLSATTPSEKKGILFKFKDIIDRNNDYFNTRIKALENYLKVEYIDEKSIVNGKENQVFKGYRKIQK